MDVHEFHKDFLEEVKSTAAIEGEGSNSAFVNLVTDYLIGAEVLSDFTPSYYIGTGKNNRKVRADGFVFDEFDSTFNLVISDYSGDENRDGVTKSYATALFERLIYFIEEALDGKLYKNIEPSTPAADLVDLLRSCRNKTNKYRLLLLTDGFMSNRIHEIEVDDYDGIPIDCQIWDIERVYRVCSSNSGKQEIEIDFRDYNNGDGIPCIEASATNNDEYKSYLCIIPGETLADIYDKYGSQLLEGNVRSFLSTKVAVNKKIRETILRNPQYFFAYNNGVSATAVDLIIESTPDGRKIVCAKDFQIINGGQTTASLSNARYKDKAELGQIYVQMKLTEVDSDAEKSTELIRNISRSSNSQNKVSDADFFSTHPFHIRMEQFSRRLYAPATGGSQYETKWFYERARGQYLQTQMHMTKAQKDKFVTQNPKKQVVTKTDFAKVRNSWRGVPHMVSKGAQTNFVKFADYIDESWSKSDTQFNEKYYKDSMALVILFKQAEYVVSHQPWFESGYRANIVTYSIALLHQLIQSQFSGMDLDLQLIWNRQQVPDIITCELVKITKYVFDQITDSSLGAVNVTQWCKKEDCWNIIKKCDLKLSVEVRKVLIDRKDAKAAEKAAEKDQRIVSDIEAQTEVINLGVEYWNKLNLFAKEKRIAMTDNQIRAMKYALLIPERFPSPYQSLQLLKLKEDAMANGFKE